MAQAFTHEVLSGSTHGAGIKVTGTSGAASVDVHTAINSSTSRDEIWIYAINGDADGEVRTLTIGFGGETAVDNEIICPVPCKAGPVLVIPGFPLRNNLVVTAWADEANDVALYGWVNRVTVT